MINIKFKPTAIITTKHKYFLGALPFLAFIGFIFLRFVKPQKILPGSRHIDTFTLGAMLFDTEARLQKEIWEDEGVIVGRSLDMFISKLRKKLEADPNIKIVVIRGKGYKLEISA